MNENEIVNKSIIMLLKVIFLSHKSIMLGNFGAFSFFLNTISKHHSKSNFIRNLDIQRFSYIPETAQ